MLLLTSRHNIVWHTRSSQPVVWVKSGHITEMSSGLLVSVSHFLPRVSVQKHQSWRSYHSRFVVAKKLPLILLSIMSAPVLSIPEAKRLTTGWLIKSLTSFAQPTGIKLNRWLGVGSVMWGHRVDRLTVTRMRRVRCVWCWISTSPTKDLEVDLTLVLRPETTKKVPQMARRPCTTKTQFSVKKWTNGNGSNSVGIQSCSLNFALIVSGSIRNAYMHFKAQVRRKVTKILY